MDPNPHTVQSIIGKIRHFKAQWMSQFVRRLRPSPQACRSKASGARTVYMPLREVISLLIQAAELKFLPWLGGKHSIHRLSAKASDESPEALFKPSSPRTLVKLNRKRDTDRNLPEFVDIKFIRVAVKHERSIGHNPPSKVTTRKARQ